MTTATQTPLARTHDPDSSHIAAAKAETFKESHHARILAALSEAEGPMTAGEIGMASGLTVVQVDRRMHELQKAGDVEAGKCRFCTVAGTHMKTWRDAR